jgi:DNA topoisomerase-3
VEAQKLISKKLKISPAKCMEVMEALYNKGFISYPRTETNSFNPTIDLKAITKELFYFDPFVPKLLDFDQKLWVGPRKGTKDDKAHPPIHPVRLATEFENKDSEKIYDLLVRHFLACLTRNAEGNETEVEITIADEVFQASGIIVTKPNFLEIYDKWTEKELPDFKEGEYVSKHKLEVKQGVTTPPKHLTESDLISEMDENGIGTDATIHEHIKNI